MMQRPISLACRSAAALSLLLPALPVPASPQAQASAPLGQGQSQLGLGPYTRYLHDQAGALEAADAGAEGDRELEARDGEAAA